MKAVIAIIATAGLSVFFAALAFRARQRRRRFLQWEPVEAIIISKYVKPLDHSDIGSATEFNAAVTYRYEMNGREYIGHRLYFQGSETYAGRSALRDVERFLDLLPEKVCGRCNPRQPTKAALFPPSRSFCLAPMVGSMLFVLFALFQFFLYLAE